jgi:hypothetical protein
MQLALTKQGSRPLTYGLTGQRGIGKHRSGWKDVFEICEHQNGLVAFRPQHKHEDDSLPSGQRTVWPKTIPAGRHERKITELQSLSCPAIYWRVVVPLAVQIRFIWVHDFIIMNLCIKAFYMSAFRLSPFTCYWNEETWEILTSTRSNMTWINKTWRFQMHINWRCLAICWPRNFP